MALAVLIFSEGFGLSDKKSTMTSKKTPFQFKIFLINKMIYFSLVPPVIRRKSSSASAGGGSPGSKSLHLSPLSNSERHPRKSQTLCTFPDPGPLSAGSGTRDIYNIKSIVQVSMWACKKTQRSPKL